ncbi:hypothetical protein HMPREF9248_0990 [Fannyhessea vaginae PB189-T1-4]|uniref:Uncharacterized protein n=1 Tax=Fannyhessea vaginae PB189-T1-4 TaxID=866774 RepID=A0ABN0B0A7_9ACTN|nr:hypothetical protein HMPREF9248_0990 [Fannyhessea vaginae PB189-T1-4]
MCAPEGKSDTPCLDAFCISAGSTVVNLFNYVACRARLDDFEP